MIKISRAILLFAVLLTLLGVGRNLAQSSHVSGRSTMQESLAGYRFDVLAGNYQADLLFAELKINKPGERVFSVKINGEIVMDSVNRARPPGFEQASIKQCRINTKGGLDIEFVPVKGKPIISGIKVNRIKS